MRALVVSLSAAALVVFALVYHVTPAGWGRIIPECRYKSATGKNCIGCGGTRSAHALVHGDIGRAFYFNALFVGSLPAGLLYVSILCARLRRVRAGAPQLIPPSEVVCVIALGGIAALGFWYVRNQEWYPWF
jgi:hypothetical protein